MTDDSSNKGEGKKGEDNQVEDKDSARRGVLKKLLVGGGVAATAKMMPDEWQKPVVESVILPAHAGFSPTNGTNVTVIIDT